MSSSMSNVLKRLQEIQKLLETEKDGNAREALREEEGLLEYAHSLDQRLSIPKLTCCHEGKNCWRITYRLPRERGGPIEDGHWQIRLEDDSRDPDLSDSLPNMANMFGRNRNRPAIQFCPFCGTAVPKMEKNPEETRPVQNWSDDMEGDYCETCDQAYRSCLCYPPEAALRPVGGTPKKRKSK